MAPGPATLCTTVPVSTNRPEPIMWPTPSKVKSNVLRQRRSGVSMTSAAKFFLRVILSSSFRPNAILSYAFAVLLSAIGMSCSVDQPSKGRSSVVDLEERLLHRVY